jgi:5-aminolevulinate synthase
MTTDYDCHFSEAITRLRDENRYRVFADLERDAARFPTAIWRPERLAGPSREITIWCSNDYLAMGGHQKVVEAAVHAAQRHGVGAGGTRNISSTHHPIVELVTALADLRGKPAVLAFTSGWISNLAAISTIAQLLPNCLILSDALNHNSIIEGVRRVGCERQIWRPREADSVRESVLYGWRHCAGHRDRRARQAPQRDDLHRRSACCGHVGFAGRRNLRARRCDGPN